MYTKEEFLEGQVLLIDKPLEWSSFDAVNAVKWAIKRKFGLKKIKVGHAGTLDPLASGLLVICTGRATKKIQQIQSLEKEYTGTMTLGATTPSYDMETEIDQVFGLEKISEQQILEATKNFIGTISQKPPLYSAVRREGKRLYEYARAGKAVEINAREVHISEFEITAQNLPEVEFRVVCSKGTYIRSLAHDFGLWLGCGAYLSTLRRTKIGPYNVNKALHPKKFGSLLATDGEGS